MNYDNEEEKREKAPPILGKLRPSFKKSSIFGRPPAFSKAAGSLLERIKSLSKKDLAFVAVGLSVLVAAPVAEYMMSKPAGADRLAPGFGQRAGGGDSLYEPGINSLSQGSPDGTGEVVTLLSSRDPASLIIGSESSQPPAAPQQAAPKTDFRDSMKDSARNGFTEATKAAGVPSVIPKMQSSLRGMGSFFSGGEGTRTTGLGGDKILSSAKNASGKAAARSMVGPVGGAGYRGVASNNPNSASKGAMDKLRAQADKAASNFSGDNSIRSLDKAASDSVDLGKSLGGLGGNEGEKYARTSGSSLSDKKSMGGGDSMEMTAAKARQAKALENEFFYQYEIPKQIVQAALTGFTGQLTKFVGGVSERIIPTPSDPPPPTTYCWSPKVKPSSADPADCLKGVMKTPIMKDKDGKVTWHPSFSCICGIGAKADVGGPAADPDPKPDPNPAPNPEPGPGQLPNTVPTSYTESLAKYDEALAQLVDNAKEGEKATAPKALLQYTKAAADSITTCSALAKVLYADVSGKTPKLASAEKAPYHTALLAAETKIAGARNKYDAFVSKVDAEIARLEGGGKTLIGDAEVLETAGGVKPVAVLKAVKAEAEDYQSNSIAMCEKKLAFHKKAEAFYEAQSGFITGQAGSMTEKTGETSGKVVELVAGLKGITDETAALPDNVTMIKDAFRKLTGKQGSIPAAPAAPVAPVAPAAAEEPDKEPLDYTVVAPAPPYTPAEGGEEAYLAGPVAWRGADGNKLWNERKVDDSAVKKTEGDYWASASPFKRLEGRNIDGDLPPADKIGGDIIAMSIRGVAALPYDIKGSNGLTPEITQGMEMLESKIDGWTAQLKGVGVSIGSSTGAAVTPAPAPSGESVAGLDKKRIMDSARDVPALQTAADGTMANLKAGKSASSAFKTARNNAGAQYEIMQNRDSSIKTLRAEIEANPSKASPAKYKELERLVGEYNLAKKGDGTPQNRGFDHYAEQANQAGRPASASVKPASPVIIQNQNINTLRGGNAKAEANADANADAHSGSTSNAGIAVKPPVAAQPEARPADPSPNLSFAMPDGRQMVLTRSEFYPATGRAVYKGFHRETGSNLLILAKTAYNFKVICTLSAERKIYRVSQTLAAPVAFPKDEETSWLVKVVMKKFLRVEDIQFGKYYDMDMFLGTSCMQ